MILCLICSLWAVKIMYSNLSPHGSLKLYEFIAMVTAVMIVLSQLPTFHSLRHINLVSLLLSLGYTFLVVGACIHAGTTFLKLSFSFHLHLLPEYSFVWVPLAICLEEIISFNSKQRNGLCSTAWLLSTFCEFEDGHFQLKQKSWKWKEWIISSFNSSPSILHKQYSPDVYPNCLFP